MKGPSGRHGRTTDRSEMKKFQLVRVAFAVAAIVALAVELGAGHKFG
jgi:hypothetical protein